MDNQDDDYWLLREVVPKASSMSTSFIDDQEDSDYDIDSLNPSYNATSCYKPSQFFRKAQSKHSGEGRQVPTSFGFGQKSLYCDNGDKGVLM